MAMKFLGITEDHTQCMHCGKSDLQQTVAFEDERGMIFYYGTTCASHVSTVGRNFKKQLPIAKREFSDRETIQNWIAKGYNAKQVQQGIANKLGYGTNINRNGVLTVFMSTGEYNYFE